MIEEGKFKVWLSIADKHAIYGKSVNGYELYTGVIYKKALVVPIGCVYSMDGNSYIRTVDENGIYKSDIEVKTGFANDEFICIRQSPFSLFDTKQRKRRFLFLFTSDVLIRVIPKIIKIRQLVYNELVAFLCL